jgi:hypothetical protein
MRKSEKFVTEKSFKRNLVSQLDMSPEVLAQLRKHGVNEDTKLKLEYFFYTDTAEKGKALAQELEKLKYSVECRKSVNEIETLVTGWTEPMNMSNETVVSWTEKMCKLGYEYDCDFDGWGTKPE